MVKPNQISSEKIKYYLNNFSRYSPLQGGVFEVAGPYFLRAGVEFGPNTSRAQLERCLDQTPHLPERSMEA